MENPQQAEGLAPAALARRLVRMGLKASLATVDGEGAPFVSLVLTATDWAGAPVLLLSRLAQHTRNLERDQRASLLFEDAVNAGHPLDRARVSLQAVAERLAEPDADGVGDRFLRRHEDARGYASFADFSFWRMRPMGAHLVAGFARIHSLAREDMLVPTEGAAALLAGESLVLAELNRVLEGAAGACLGAKSATGVDPEGVDLLSNGNALRIDFGAPCLTPMEAVEATMKAISPRN